MSLKNFEVYAERASFGRYVRVWISGVTKQSNDRMPMCQPVVVCDIDSSSDSEPTLEMDNRTAQNLMDALWAAGLRPNSGEGMDAQVTAIKAHLADMRTLVFNK